MIYENSESLIGKVVYIKQINKNETVGYYGSYKARKKQIIGICDIGYYNGIRRNYKGRVSINDKYYKIVGKICMNHMFIVIDSNVKIGDFVTIYGKNIPKSEFLSHNMQSNYESFLLIR
jgi:alanine racemase